MFILSQSLSVSLRHNCIWINRHVGGSVAMVRTSAMSVGIGGGGGGGGGKPLIILQSIRCTNCQEPFGPL